MLEGFLREKLRGTDIRVESAGTYVGVEPEHLRGKPANEHSITCMNGYNLDITRHQSRWIGDIKLNEFDLVVCMTDNEIPSIVARNYGGLLMVANATNGGVPNPWQKGLPAYEECALVLSQVANQVVAYTR
jgi:protein-tyrosine-phosphatase